jgi:hypothetical protein
VDYESYDWSRLDGNDPATRAIVDAFFTHEEEVMTYQPHKPQVYDKYAGNALYSASIFK